MRVCIGLRPSIHCMASGNQAVHGWHAMTVGKDARGKGGELEAKVVTQDALEDGTGVLGGDQVTVVTQSCEPRPLAVDASSPDGATGQQNAAGGAMIGATGAVDGHRAAKLGDGYHGGVLPAFIKLGVQRCNPCIQLFKLACQHCVLASVGVPAVVFDHGDLGTICGGQELCCRRPGYPPAGHLARYR